MIDRLLAPSLFLAALLLWSAALSHTAEGSPPATAAARQHRSAPISATDRTARPAAPTPTASVVPTPTTTPASAPEAPAEITPRYTAVPAPSPTATPTPFPSVAPAVTARFAPTRIIIPRINLDAAVVPIGVTPDGRLGTPPDYVSVGWYQFGPLPGEIGRAVLAGHLDSRTGPAVFYRLGNLVPGDEIVIRSSGAGPDLTFAVRETMLVETDEAPLDLIYGTSDHPELVLITCGGPFDRGAREYLQRQIVIAELRE